MTDILNQLEVAVECEQCGTFTTSGDVIAECQRLLDEGCPGSPYECPLEHFAGLLDQAALDALAKAWKSLEHNALRRGERVSLNRPLHAEIHSEEHSGSARWAEDAEAPPQTPADSAARTEALKAHLVGDSHDYLWARLPFLVPMAIKISRTCGARAPECARLASLVQRLHTVVLHHLDHEERILKRMNTAPDDSFIVEELACLRDEHDHIVSLLRLVCEAADRSTVTADACPTVCSFHEELHRIEQHLRTQMRIEDELLSSQPPATAL